MTTRPCNSPKGLERFRLRRARVNFELRKRGLTLAELARRVAVSRQAIYLAFRRPYPRMERVIAAAIDTAPHRLWPERYDRHGLPNRRPGRPRNRITKDSTIRAADRRMEREAA